MLIVLVDLQLIKKLSWYKRCHHSKLNERYLFGTHSSTADEVTWYHWKVYQYSLKFTEIKVKQNY